MLNVILDKLEGVRKTNNGYIALCPCHDDKRPSLSIAEADDGRVLIYCFAGCCTKDICQALGIGLKDLFPENATREQKENSKAFRKRQDFDEMCNQAFVAMAEFRDLTLEIFESTRLDIPTRLARGVHMLPLIDYWMEILSTGSEADRLELLRQGVIHKWQRLHQSAKQQNSI